MAFRQSNSGGDGAIIAQGVIVKGRISGSGNLTLAGNLQGEIELDGDFVLAPGAVATSNVDARDVTVEGSLEGDVQARGAIRITVGAKVHGNLSGGSVTLEDGAEFAGRIEADFELPPELGGSTAANFGSSARSGATTSDARKRR